MNILVCDDDHAIVDAIEIYLSQEGYRVLKAYDGLEAIKMLQEHEIHLILLSHRHPLPDRQCGKYDFSSLQLLQAACICAGQILHGQSIPAD